MTTMPVPHEARRFDTRSDYLEHRFPAPGMIREGDRVMPVGEWGLRGGTLYTVSDAKTHAALREAALSPGDCVVYRAGTYRGGIRPKAGGTSEKPITYACYPGEKVVITGSYPVKGFKPYKGDVFVGEWSNLVLLEGPGGEFAPRRVTIRRGEAVVPLENRAELLVRGGSNVFLRPVARLEDVGPGTFYAEDKPGGEGDVARLYVWGDPAGLELAQDVQLFASHGENPSHPASVDRGHYRVVGDFSFRHAASARQGFAVTSGKRPTLFDGIEASYNRAGGIRLAEGAHVARGCRAAYNGVQGIGGPHASGSLIEYSVNAHNNWVRGKEVGWEGGAGKFVKTVGMTVRYNYFANNLNAGLWFDHVNYDNRIYGNVFAAGDGRDVFLELDSSRNVISGNVFIATRYRQQPWCGAGVVCYAGSDQNTVAFNTFIKTGQGVKIHGDDRALRHPDIKRTTTRENTVWGNVFSESAESRSQGHGYALAVEGVGAESTGRVTAGAAADNALSHRIAHNAYTPKSSPAVLGDSTFFLHPSKTGGTLRTNEPGDFRAATGHEEGSVVTSPLPAIAVPAWKHGMATIDDEAVWRKALAVPAVNVKTPLPPGAPPLYDLRGQRIAESAVRGAVQPKRAGGGVVVDEGAAGEPGGFSWLTVKGVTASRDQPPHIPANVIDGNPETRWSARGRKEWIELDLVTPKDVTALEIAWHEGDSRKAPFVVKVSDDRKAWTQVFAGASSGKTSDFERYALSARARYVRIFTKGTNKNTWNSIAEVRLR